MPLTFTIDTNTNRINFSNFYAASPGLPPSISMSIEEPARANNLAEQVVMVANNNLTQSRLETLRRRAVSLGDPNIVTNNRNVLLFTREQLTSLRNDLNLSAVTALNSTMHISEDDIERRLREAVESLNECITDYSMSSLRGLWFNDIVREIDNVIYGASTQMSLLWNRDVYNYIKRWLYPQLIGENVKLRDSTKKTMFRYSSAISSSKKKQTKPKTKSYASQQWDILETLAMNLPFHVQESIAIRLMAEPVIVPEVVDTTKPKVTIFSLNPTLKRGLRDLRKSYSARAEHMTRRLDDIDTSYVQHCFDKFNEIKTAFMLHGYSEANVASMLTRIMVGKLNYSKETVTCCLTEQIIPYVLSAPFLKADGTTGRVNWKYILYCMNNSRHSDTARYQIVYARYPDTATDSWFYKEIVTSDNLYYSSNVMNYQAKTQHFLTPRWMHYENVKTLGKDSKYTPQPWLGIELEVERREGCPENITEPVYQALGRDYVMFKTDSSLSGYKPWEIVTVPATLNYHKHRWLDFLDNMELKKHLQSYASGKCGMHVHISRDSFNGLHLAKFMRFINSPENTRFITKIAQRGGNSHCKYVPYTRISDASSQMFSVGDRHKAINTNNSGTIEVRIFRGNLSKHAFLKNLEFVHAAWAYTKDCSVRSLDYKDFLMWLLDPSNNHDKQYSNLQAWVIANDYNVSNIQIGRELSKDEKLKLIQKRKEVKRIQVVVGRKYDTNTEKDTIRKGQGLTTKAVVSSNQ